MTIIPPIPRNPFLGLANYRRLIRDEVFWKAVGNTVFFCVAAVSANIVVTLFLAKLISVLPSKGLKTVFRTIFFIPCIAPMVGTAMIWKYGIIGTENGVVNQIVQFFGGTPKNWFMTGLPLMMFIILYTLWADIPVQHLVLAFPPESRAFPRSLTRRRPVDGAGSNPEIPVH